jgi:hypothetical protein
MHVILERTPVGTKTTMVRTYTDLCILIPCPGLFQCKSLYIAHNIDNYMPTSLLELGQTREDLTPITDAAAWK